MKPKALKAPFLWEQRRPCIQDKVFFVPIYYAHHNDFTFPGWESPAVFLKPQPIMVEYCSGNGAWLIERAIQSPHLNWVGVELQFERVRQIWAKMKSLNLTNLFIVCGEAQTFSKYYVPSKSVSEIFINFPDPWPKRRHQKHRLIAPHFLEEMNRALAPQGTITFVTDDVHYREWTVAHFAKAPLFKPVYPAPFYCMDIPGYGSSFFEILWREQGRSIFYLQYRKEEPAYA